jgi:alkylation response protein AidB-like acyl-CoA dehydrogenase
MQELRTMVREFCQEVVPEAVVRRIAESDSGADPALWARIGGELGVFGLAVPEELGGAGLELVHHAVVIDELGAALVPGPVLGTLCLALPALLALGDAEVQHEYLPGLVAGETVATLIAPDTRGEFDAEAVTITADRSADGWALSGRAAQVPDGFEAELLLVAAQTGDGVALFAVEGGASGVERTALSTLDLTRRQADVSFAGSPARLIAEPGEAEAVCARAVLVATALLAVEQVGGSQRMLDVTVAHVSGRLQFGQPVGAYQAVKHRAANMLISVEQARSAAYHAVWALQDGTDDPVLAASLAKAVASETYSWVSASAIQLHGGLGFTWEGTPQLYFKRATTDALTLGTAQQHIDRLSGIVLDPLTTV